MRVLTDLHNKYRPGTFDGVLGQKDVVKSVKNVLAKGLCRSFIFTGPSGVGKTTIARIIAKELDCDKHNLLEINGAAYTGIDDMRQILERLSYLPIGTSPIRVVIVDEAHALSKQAWQSLLKSVEEPPEHVYWIFCTTDVSKIPATIITRCTRYDLKAVKLEDIRLLLGQVCNAEGLEISPRVLAVIADKSDGSPRRALTGLSKCYGCETRDEAIRAMHEVEDESAEVIDLCRALIGGLTWKKAMRLLVNMKDANPESIRLVMLNYLSKVAMSSKDPDRAGRVLELIDCFSTPCHPSEGMAPILLALGRAILSD